MISDVGVHLLSGLVLGLANSAHCAGMCGAFAVQAGRCPGRFLSYWAGKTATYVFLGTLAATVSAPLLREIRALASILALITGACMIWAAVSLVRGVRASRWSIAVNAWISPWVRPIREQFRSASPLLLGFATGFLPCTVVYLAILNAIAGGSVGAGALRMGAFALGTAPVLAGVSLFAGTFRSRLGGRRLVLLGSALLLLSGALMMVRVIGPWLSHGNLETPACCRSTTETESGF